VVFRLFHEESLEKSFRIGIFLLKKLIELEKLEYSLQKSKIRAMRLRNVWDLRLYFEGRKRCAYTACCFEKA